MNFIPNVSSSSSSSPSHSFVSLLSLEQNPHCREFMLSILTCATHSFLPHSTIIKQLNNPCHLLHKNNNNRRRSSSTTAQAMKNIKNIAVSAKSAFILFNLYLQFYVNAGLMNEARNLFDETNDRTLIQWTILMSGYIRHGPMIETLSVFRNLLEDHNLKPDSYVYAVVIRACSTLENLDFGREVHCRILKTDGAMDLFVENALVTMYSSCGSVEDAVRVFDGISRPDLVSWSSMLNGYVQNGFEEEGLRLFIMMIQNGICPDAFAFSMVVGASTHLGYLDLGVQVHCYIVKTGFGSCLFLENSLIDFYAKCGDPDSSKKVFHQMTERNLVSWNTVIKGSVHNVDYHVALRLFRDLMNETCHCDDFTLPAVLKAITGLGALHYGKQVHGYIIRAGFESNVYVISSLLDMYIECINHESSEAIKDFPPKIFNSLKEIEYDEFITASILKWCSLEVDLETGKAIHSQIIKHNQLSDSYVLSSLIDMYAKCGIPEAAQRVFVRIKNKSMVPWSAVISGHCWNGWFEEALKFFQKMQSDGIEANEYIYTSVLLACLALGYVNKGRELHCKILRTGFGSNVSVVNTLINLYSELMGHQQALKLCTLIPEAEVSWDFLIQACLRVQAHETVFKLVQRIQQVQGKLDSTTASYILSSCANPVLLNAGTQLQAYVTKRGLMSDPLTSNSLIKMYSGCGKVTDSIAAFNQSPVKNSDSWTSIISTHVDHGHPSQAIELFTQLRQKNRLLNKDTFIFALKAYAQMGMVDEVFRLFISMDQSYGIKPSIEHYSYMVEVLGRAGKFEEAQEYINGVFPLKPEPLIWRPLLSACRVHGNIRVVKYVVEKLIEFEPSDFTANLLLKQVLLTEGKWDEASKMKTFNKSVRSSSSWIEIRNKIYEFVSGQIPPKFISDKLAEIERTMEGLGYIGDRNHLLHNAEEEDYAGVGLHHTEMKALAFGLLSSPAGVPIRIMKSVRMCGDCHSACKFMSTFLGRDLVVKDTCSYHHFENGKCSCRDSW